jgi:uncharacterized protein (TIGR01244 family)
MNNQREITPELTIADQPTAADLESLRTEGYTAVVNLRNDGEPEQPLGTAEEGDLVRELGMDYLHVGVGGSPLDEARVGSFCAFLDRHANERVLVHCRKGSRAAALTLLHRALHEHWSPSEVAAKGREIGLEVEGGLRTMVETYLTEHNVGL